MQHILLALSFVILAFNGYSFNRYDSFTDVQEAIKSNSEYIELDLSNQGLVNLPPRISKIKNLKAINLSNNPFLDVVASIDSLKGLKGLRSIRLENLNLRFIPINIYELSHVKELHLGHNKLTFLPDGIKQMKGLEELYLEDNNITFFKPGFMSLSNLKILDVTKNGSYDQKSFFYVLSLMSSISELRVDAESGLDGEISSLTRLKKLVLYRPILNDDALILARLSQLEELEIINGVSVNYEDLFNSLDTLPVRKLNIKDNSIIELHENISKLESLREIKISGWNFNNLPNSIKELRQLQKVCFIETPNINIGKTLGRLPKDQISSLMLIDCSRNKFPEELYQFKNLKKIDVSKNEISALPTGLRGLKLDQLVFYNNPINDSQVKVAESKMPNCEFIFGERKMNTIARNSVIGVSPPVPKLDVFTDIFKINVEQPSVLKYNSGTKINIPANAFLDKNGEVVTGQVELGYREFNDPIEVAFSGIPMGYDSAGVNYSFSSSGMLEINASKDGEPVFINPENKISIEMVSNNDDPGYNLYSMTDGEGWEYKGKDSIYVDNPEPIKKRNFEYSNDFIRIPKPTLAVLKSGVTFDFEVGGRRRSKGHFVINQTHLSPSYFRFNSSNKRDRKNFSELKNFNRYYWFIDGKDQKAELKRFDSLSTYVKIYNERMRDWRYSPNREDSLSREYNLILGANLVEDVWVEPNYEADNFLLNFVMCGDTIRFEILPGINGSYTRRIQAQNDRIYSSYLKELNKRKGVWKTIDDKHGDYIEKYNEGMVVHRQEVMAYEKDKAAYLFEKRKEVATYEASSFNVQRSFQIDGFGYWNCDVINRMIEPKHLMAGLYNEELERLNPKELMIVDITNNGVLRYSNGTGKKLYDNKSSNAIIAFLDDEQIALLIPEKFDSQPLNRVASKPKLEIFNVKDISIGDIKTKVGMPIN